MFESFGFQIFGRIHPEPFSIVGVFMTGQPAVARLAGCWLWKKRRNPLYFFSSGISSGLVFQAKNNLFAFCGGVNIWVNDAR